MKYLAGGLLPLLFASNLFALNLCDSSCNLSITFPDGGSIKADDDIKITFGEGGYINNGSGTIAYHAGERLKLDDDESLVFQSGGLFDLGRGGNIKYKDMQITSNGIIELAAVKGKALVKFDDMTLNGDVSLNISSDFEVVKKAKFLVRDGLVTATADLTFSNNGYVKGNFQFEDAVLTYSDGDEGKSVFELLLDRFNRSSKSGISEDDYTERQEISGIVFLDTNRRFTVVTKAVALFSNEVPTSVTVPNNSVDEGVAEDVETSSEANSAVLIEEAGQFGNQGQADTGAGNSVSVASTGGLTNIFSLFVLLVLLIVYRVGAVYTGNTRRK